MRTFHAGAAALVIAGAVAGVALAGGGAPPPTAPDPAPRTVVAHGDGIAEVVRPRVHADGTIQRAVGAARQAAIPKAVEAARAEAQVLARSAGLKLGEPIAAGRAVAPPGYWEPDQGHFGPGRWCGRIVTRRRDGVRRSRHGCKIPREQTTRVTVTFAVR